MQFLGYRLEPDRQQQQWYTRSMLHVDLWVAQILVVTITLKVTEEIPTRL